MLAVSTTSKGTGGDRKAIAIVRKGEALLCDVRCGCALEWNNDTLFVAR